MTDRVDRQMVGGRITWCTTL